LPSLILIAVTREYHIYAGIGHYTAEIVPFAILAALVGVRRLAGLATRLRLVARRTAVAGCCVVMLLATLWTQTQWGFTPVRAGMGPVPLSPHARLAQRMLALIPPAAAVSAEQTLGPHLGNRPDIYLFPDLGPHQEAEYVALDLTDDPFPLSSVDPRDAVQRLLSSGRWGVRFADDGLLLLERGLKNSTTLPPALLGFLDLRDDGPDSIVLARFGTSLELVDYRLVYHPLRYLGYPVVELATRWRVLAPVPSDLHLANYITDARGEIVGAWTDFAATDWYPPSRWKPGQTFWVQMHAARIPLGETGQATIEIGVFHGNYLQTQTPSARLPVTLPRPARRGLDVSVDGTLLLLNDVDMAQ
jgi:hypothetical protein